MKRVGWILLCGIIIFAVIFGGWILFFRKSFAKVFAKSETVCFIGDSVTAGSNNGGYPWYLPLLEDTEKDVFNRSWGGATTKDIIENKDEYCWIDADLYIIAIGTNDIRYNDSERGAVTKEQYIENLEQIVSLINHPTAEYIFITPWYSVDWDPVSALSYEEKMKQNNEYSDALKKWCWKNRYLYVDPQPYIIQKIQESGDSYYLEDYIHPNGTVGIEMYSEAVTKYHSHFGK